MRWRADSRVGLPRRRLALSLAASTMLALPPASAAAPRADLDISRKTQIVDEEVPGWHTVVPGRVPYRYEIQGGREGDRIEVRVDRVRADSWIPGERERVVGRYGKPEKRTLDGRSLKDDYTVRLDDSGGFFRITLTEKRDGEFVAQDRSRFGAPPCGELFPGRVHAGKTCAGFVGLPRQPDLESAAASAPRCDRSSYGERSGPCQFAGVTGSAPPYRGLMLIAASGGWLSSPGAVIDTIRQGIPASFARESWLTLVLEVTPGGIPGQRDLHQWVSQWQAVFDSAPGYGRRFPICLWGGSSGGNLSLKVAVYRQLDCVIAESPPTDLTDLYESCLIDPGDSTGGFCGAAFLAWIAYGSLEAFPFGSPISYDNPPFYGSTPILLGTVEGDPLVPPAQSARFDDENGSQTEVFHIRQGGDGERRCIVDCFFTHSFAPISRAGLLEWRERTTTIFEPLFPR